MNIFYIFSSIITILSSLSLGIFVFLKAPRNITNRVWFLMSICVAAWSGGFCAMVSGIFNKNITLLFDRVSHIGAIFIPIFYLYFVLALLNKIKEHKRILYIGYFCATFLLFFVFSRWFITDMLPKLSFKYYPQAGIFYSFFVVMFFAFVIFAQYLMLRNFKLLSEFSKKQIKYVLIASTLGFLGGGTTFPLVYNIPILPVGGPLVFIYTVIITYAILAHQLMDIEVIIRRAAVFAGLFAFAYGVFSGIAYLGQTFFQRFIVNRWFAMMPSVLIIVLAFEPLKNLLVRLTDKFLFQKKYDYKELLKTFSGEVLTVLDLNKLVRLTVDKLSSIVRLENCAVLLFDKEKGNYKLVSSNNLKETNTAFEKDDPIIKFIHETHTYILKNKDIQNMKDKGTIKEGMKKLESELILPIVLHNDLVGLISLGRKKSGGEFTEEDLGVLLPLAQTEAIALSNAELFDELGKTQQEAAQREKMAVVGTLAAGINHEICNPLGIVRGHCETFILNKQDGLYNDKSDKELLNEAMRVMQIAIKETDRATSITKKLSSFSKPSKGEIFDNVNIEKELDEIISLIGYELKLDKIRLTKNIPPNISNIKADRKQIQEIFFNLIRNSAQAITSEGEIRVSASQQDSKVLIDIADTGCGIPEDKLEQIFNPFYTTKEPGKGTGLGLFIVRQVVERNNGKISVRSKVGEGTTFTLEFQVYSKT